MYIGTVVKGKSTGRGDPASSSTNFSCLFEGINCLDDFRFMWYWWFTYFKHLLYLTQQVSVVKGITTVEWEICTGEEIFRYKNGLSLFLDMVVWATVFSFFLIKWFLCGMIRITQFFFSFCNRQLMRSKLKLLILPSMSWDTEKGIWKWT